MSEQTYATPKSNLTASSAEIGELIGPLMATKPWVRLCSIIGFIFTGLMVIGGLAAMVGGMAASSALGGALGGTPAAFMGIFYILFSLFYFFPSLFLFKYASAIATANETQSSADIAMALGYQKSFWKFVGIFTLVMLIIFAITFGFGIMMGMTMAGI